MESVELFSQDWCEQAKQVWEDVVVPNLADPDNYNYIVEFSCNEINAVTQLKAEKGIILHWDAEKRYTDDECTFLIDAKKENWQKIAAGQLDPVGAVASKRVHMKKGPMTVVIKEAKAFTQLLEHFGQIPTAW